MAFLGQVGALGPGLVTVTRDPSLVGLDTGAMRAAAGVYASAGQKLSDASGQISSTASSVVGTPAWIGAGGIAFSMSADQASGAARTAAGALGPVSSALNSLVATLDAAMATATQAETLASQVNTQTAQLNSSYQQRVAAVTAAQPPLTANLLAPIAPTAPTGADFAAAAQLDAQATQAAQMMVTANQQAHIAWQAAAAAFDAATAQAPSVRAAVARSQAAAATKYKSDHQSNLLLGGLSALGVVALPVASGLADFFSGGAAAVATPEEAVAEAGLTAEAAAGLTGTIDEVALAASQEAAGAGASVDGTALDSQIAKDVAQPPPPAASGMSAVRQTGINGENAAGINQAAKVRIPSASGSAAYRIPDELTNTTLTEVKNVSNLSYTSQLRDFYQYSSTTGRSFDLVVRGNTRLSGPLQDMVNNGSIRLDRTLP